MDKSIFDHTFHGAEEDKPDVRTVVHLLGGATPANSDGYQESWYTKDFEVTGPTFDHEVYQYPNNQRTTSLWYHDHAMGITRLNVYAGLGGMYLIHDKVEDELNIQKGKYDNPLVIQDKSFNIDGSLFYEHFGNTILVNGKVWPYLDKVKVKPIKGEVEQWEIINTTQIPHPIHIHLVQFQVVGRKIFDLELYNSKKEIKYTSDLIPMNDNEKGLKDTIIVNPGQATIVRMKFEPFKGRYVWHCQILVHEDHEMMLPFDVV